MSSGGRQRRFALIVPDGYDGTTPLPLVLGLHALTVPYQTVPALTGFADMGPFHDFIGVTPSGLVDGVTPYWLAAPVADSYDVEFIADLLDLLEAELCVDSTRVFSTGMSNGGQMTSLLACRLAHRVTAAAPVAGVEFHDGCEGRPVPVMAFHGTADPIVTYDGEGLDATRIADLQYWKGEVPHGLPAHRGVDAAMQAWAAHNRCAAEPEEERISPSVRRKTWRDCEADTVLYVIDGGGHMWPGKPVPAFEATFGPGTTEIDASRLAFDFFFSQPSIVSTD